MRGLVELQLKGIHQTTNRRDRGQKKTTGPEKLIKKRRERTTKATKNGMELQKWMQTVGEENTELRRPKGIG